MGAPGPPADLFSVADLEAACRRETQRYLRGEPSDSRFCLELFHRALRQSLIQPPNTASPAAASPFLRQDARRPIYADEDARTTLVRIYSEFILANINRTARRTTPLDDLVQQVWLRFWRAANRGLIFLSLEAALSYLKQTTISTVIEAQRQAHKQQRNRSLQQLIATAGEEPLRAGDADLFDQHVQQRFRARCLEVLADPLAYRIFWMRYGMGLPPREIAHELARQGVQIKKQTATARGVSDVLERCCRQLCRDLEVQDLLRTD